MEKKDVSTWKNTYQRTLIEGVLVFSMIVSGLIFEIYTRGLIFQNGALHLNIIGLVFVRSFIATFLFVIAYKIFKSRFSLFFFFIAAKFHGTTTNQEENPKVSLWNDTFIILSIILTTTPVRPILQASFKESDIADFTYVFVRHDAIPSVIALFIIAIPLIFFIHKYKQGAEKILRIAVVGLIIIGVGWINNMPNYYARIYESSASWITRNWTKQGTDAQRALKNAKTDEEKAASYFWLGVSENRKGNHAQGLLYQLEAVKLNPRFAAAYASLANAYLATGKPEEALENAQKCIAYDPEYAWCYQALGNYHWEKGETDLAVFFFCRAAQMDNENRELKGICEWALNTASGTIK